MKVPETVVSMFSNRRLIAAMFMTSALALNMTCKKSPSSPPNNNEFNAVVLLSNGSQVTINAKGKNASMGCASFGGGTFVSGINNNNARIVISLYSTGVMCVNTAGTYPFGCQYQSDITSQISPLYTNHGVSNPGSITFTSITSKTMEGFFNTVCKSGALDSVVITGTFKGDFLE